MVRKPVVQFIHVVRNYQHIRKPAFAFLSKKNQMTITQFDGRREMWNPRTPSSMSSPLHVVLVMCFAYTLFIPEGAQANRKTDESEVQALNMIFKKWNISSTMSKLAWNTTGDPCSGYATDADERTKEFPENYGLNPSILCDCKPEKNVSICHIIRLTAKGLKIVGTIPEELKYLPKLDNLQIAGNFLTGPLPAFIGNFSDMKYLSIGTNALSGVIPTELGSLTNLISLGMGINNFCGSLPPELGNLTNLQKMYINSIGVSGEIPPTFKKLQKLTILWAFDNNFGGNIPEFLGSLIELKTLRLQGNNFQGPITSNLGNLDKLIVLQLGDLRNGTSSLEFIQNLTSLATLILRDCRISDMIPSNIGEFKLLKHIDLSFNNLRGMLPLSLFNMDSLEALYLGNNSISSSLPDAKSGKLLEIDLSYNELSGRIAPWANEDKLQVNLVANNLDVGDSNKGLDCLQRSFPCYRGRPTYYSFAINCGGGEFKSSEGTVYEADNQNLTTASYYITNTKRWAVSSTGKYVDSERPYYVEKSASTNFYGTSDPKLFQSARLSPSSLRYYGLGLENGPYNITLQFAEIAFRDLNSTRRRVFDIYIQGILVAEDFDIKREAGGIPFRAIKRMYNATVSDNFLEIHFFWAGKGHYGSLISAISVTPNFKPTVSNKPPNSTSKNRKKITLIAGLVIGIVALFSLCIIGACIWRRKRRLNTSEDEDNSELHGLATVPNSFSYSELKSATQDFQPANKVGQGGFGAVYKGLLHDGTTVAVKQLSTTTFKGKERFVTEVAAISAVNHRNLVKLYGCCHEGNNRLLVYEYLENRSLDRAIFGKSKLQLDWPTRIAICVGTARGLAYLHEESSIRIIHRDIKCGNILLDNDLNPKIADFGLAKFYDDKLTHMSTRVAGTIGYLAPEYAMRGHLTEMVDVFAFGVVILEILCGRPNSDPSLDENEAYLLEWAWTLHESMHDLDMLDPTLPSFNKEEATRLINVAFLCTQENLMLRPPMSRVVAMLVGDVEVGGILSKPTYLSDWQFDDLSREATRTTMSGSRTGASYQSPTSDSPPLLEHHITFQM